MGLKSKSHGKGELRRITVSKVTSSSGGLMMMGGNNHNQGSKKKDENSLPTLKEYKQVPRINIGKRGEEALVQHLLKFPPNDKELAESKETGSSLLLLKRKTAAADGATSVDDEVDEGGDVVVANPTSNEQHLLSLNDILPSPQETTETAATSSSHPSQQQQQKIQAKQSRIINQRIQSHHTLQQQTKQHSDYKKMMKQRQNLPAYNYATDICNVLKNSKNQVVILTGDTGCGYVTYIVLVPFCTYLIADLLTSYARIIFPLVYP